MAGIRQAGGGAGAKTRPVRPQAPRSRLPQFRVSGSVYAPRQPGSSAYGLVRHAKSPHPSRRIIGVNLSEMVHGEFGHGCAREERNPERILGTLGFVLASNLAGTGHGNR